MIGGDYQGLGIARSLGRRGIPVCVIDDEISVARASRFVQDVIRVRDLRTEQALLDALALAHGKLCLSGWVLYPTREENVAGIAANRDMLRQKFRVPTPGLASILYAWDKREVYSLAERLSIPVPRTWFPQSEKDLAAIEVDNPVVLKPAIKEHFFYATHAKAWRADTAAELLAAFRRATEIMSASEIIVQEMIPGGGEQQYAYCAFFREGCPVASMTVRRRRQHPSDFGRASTYVETISLPELAEPSCRFLTAIGYYGLVELEYKRDPRDGVCKLLDVNARTWGYHSVGGLRVDFPYLLFRDQIGAPVEEAQPGPAYVGSGSAPTYPTRSENRARVASGGVFAFPPWRAHRGSVLDQGSNTRPLRDRAAALSRGQARPVTSPAAEEEPVFEASRPFAFCDYFRVPYEVGTANEWPRRRGGFRAHADHEGTSGSGLALSDLVGADARPVAERGRRLGWYRLDNFTFFGHVAPDAAILAMLPQPGRDWHPTETIEVPTAADQLPSVGIRVAACSCRSIPAR